MNIDIKTIIHNRFDIEIYNSETGELKNKCQAFNVICDGFWNQLFGSISENNNYLCGEYGYSYLRFIAFGSGSGTPTASDTALFSWSGAKEISTSTYSRYFDREQGYFYTRGYIRLEPSEYVEWDFSELGLTSYASSNSTILTHAMMQDANGNPITLRKTATDVFVIYATVYVHWPVNGWYNSSILPRINITNAISDGFWGWLGGAMSRSQFYNRLVYFCEGSSNLDFGKLVSDDDYNTQRLRTVITKNVSNHTVTFFRRTEATQRNRPLRYFQVAVKDWLHDIKIADVCFDGEIGSWFTIPQIENESIGIGDGIQTKFRTTFPVKTFSNIKVNDVIDQSVTTKVGACNRSNISEFMNYYIGKSSLVQTDYFNYISVSGSSIVISDYNNDGHIKEKQNIFENPWNSVCKITKISCYLQFERRSYGSQSGTCEIKCSDDLETWVTLGTISGKNETKYISVPVAYQNYKYFSLKLESDGSPYNFAVQFLNEDPDDEYNVVFQTPPAAGAVITADYYPDCVAKDENHVFDFSLTISFNEYQGI